MSPYILLKRKSPTKHFCSISVTPWNNFSFCQFQSTQRPCQNQIPKTMSPIVQDIMGEHAQGTQDLLRPSAVIWLLNLRLLKLTVRLLENSGSMRLWAPVGVNNLVCWLGREQEVGSTWGTLIPCASLSHCVQEYLFTSKFYYTLLWFWFCPLQFVYLLQNRPCRQLNNAFVRETVE